jgi:4-amino-4-deoxychorismate lyase
VPGKSPSILVNGQKTDQVTVLDRGFQYGDGLFETILISSGKPQYWREHMERLLDGCRRLQIPDPDLSVLQHEAKSLYAEMSEGVLKITITRGQGGRGYAADDTAKSTRVLAIFLAPHYPQEYWSEGVVVKVCNTRVSMNPALAGIKHLNRLEQVLARAEWSSINIHEGLMLDINNNVIEGTMSNVFCVRSGELYTPELSLCGVKGIMREQVINVAKRAGIVVHETQLDLGDLHQSEECFLCNSLFGIWPIRLLEDHTFKTGPVSIQLTDSLRKIEKEHGVENVA